MYNLIHPSAIAFSIKSIDVYWYGLILALSFLMCLLAVKKLAKFFLLTEEEVFDFSFWLIIGSLIGARVYEVFLEFNYYSQNLLAVFKIWEGGLAIHGGILGGLLMIMIYGRIKKKSIWLLAGLTALVAPLGQAIGRWGNYFNQELFGKPTTLPWKIFIEEKNRPQAYIQYDNFHPTFLYESIGCLVIFCILIWYSRKHIDKSIDIQSSKIIVFVYLILYSGLRFCLEFIKIDQTPMLGNLRWPQFVSLLLFGISISFLFFIKKHKGMV